MAPMNTQHIKPSFHAREIKAIEVHTGGYRIVAYGWTGKRAGHTDRTIQVIERLPKGTTRDDAIARTAAVQMEENARSEAVAKAVYERSLVAAARRKARLS